MKITIEFDESNYEENSAASRFLSSFNRSLKVFNENKSDKTKQTFEYRNTLNMVLEFYSLEKIMPLNLTTVKNKLTALIETFHLYPVQSYLFYLLTHNMRDIAKNVDYFPTLEYGSDVFTKYNKLCAAIERNKNKCDTFTRNLDPETFKKLKISFIDGKRIFNP